MKRELLEQWFRRLELPRESLERVLPNLRLLAEYKYDRYEMFSPGERFMERLYLWLEQFDAEDRPAAMEFVQNHLVFISQDEMMDLARFLFYDHIVTEILRFSIAQEGLPEFAFHKAYRRYFSKYLRRSLFIALSDSARIDYFRRHNVHISNEQVLSDYRADATERLGALRKDSKDDNARFDLVFLIDDLNASGYSLVRQENGGLEGKLLRLCEYQESTLRDARIVFLCHYISTMLAERHVAHLASRIDLLKGKLHILPAMTLPDWLQITPESVPARDKLRRHAIVLCERYYDEAWEDSNTLRGGGIEFGFGRMGLPVVLYSNCPNDSLCILWVDHKYCPKGSRFNALFPRIPRHGRWYGREF